MVRLLSLQQRESAGLQSAQNFYPRHTPASNVTLSTKQLDMIANLLDDMVFETSSFNNFAPKLGVRLLCFWEL
jgi:hypothetical protein